VWEAREAAVPMRIKDVLRNKGDKVITIGPDGSVRLLLDLLAEHHIGAVVVSGAPGAVDGIVSERDVVRGLRREGERILDGPVSHIMTSVVHTATPNDAVDDLMLQMTDKRVRHLPVLSDGRLVGIVSIGDLVNSCIAELRIERDQLTAYITS
jgi:CBS domain-containing protein